MVVGAETSTNQCTWTQAINWGQKNVTIFVPKLVDKCIWGTSICQDQDHLVTFTSNLERTAERM